MNSRIRLVTALGAVIGVALVTSLWTPASAATATANLAVSANVVNNCAITTTALAFGTYDPIVANLTVPLDGTGGVVIRCNRGTVTTIGLGLGLNPSGSVRRMIQGADFLTYELYNESTRSVVWTNSGAGLLTTPAAPSKAPVTFTVYGRVAIDQDVPAGTFTDTVIATVTF
jgi:spore coat protein U-like protein